MNAIASVNAATVQRVAGFALAFVAMFVLAAPAFAGTDGQDVFGDAYLLISGFTEGFLGKLVTLLMIVTGLVMGIARQSIMTLVVGVGMGIALVNAPKVVDTLVGAVL